MLLIAATKFEIAPILQVLAKERYLFNKHEMGILITGVGAVNTTYHLTKKLHTKKVDLVIQAGIAGMFDSGLSLGQTVLIRQDAFGDVGLEEKKTFSTLFDAGFAGKDDFPFTDRWLINTNKFLDQSLLNVVKAVTVNKVSDSLIQRQQLINNFSPEIESMEGAAFHFVCLQEKTPFIQIRSISNIVGERDKNKWSIEGAIINLNIELEKLINNL
jgi:futalosine hydrolase